MTRTDRRHGLMGLLAFGLIVVAVGSVPAMPGPLPCPSYPAEVTRIIDADTFQATVFLAFETQRSITVRVSDIDAPERSDPDGPAATAVLTELLAGGEVRVSHPTDGKFGRHACRVYARCSGGRGIAVADVMRAKGFGGD